MGERGIKAEWHLAEMTEADDPFAQAVYSTGVTIDLTGSEAELSKTMVELMWREKRMFDNGLTCDLKWAGQDCRTCPQATLDPEEHRSRLCRLGKDQAAVEAAWRGRREQRLGDIEELAAVADAATEVGGLPDELLELVALAGL